MNERILLKFLDYDPANAAEMVAIARAFVSAKPNGLPGPRHGAVYRARGAHFLARWTAARTVVVEELEKEPNGSGS